MSRIIGCEGLHFALLNSETDVVGGTPTWEDPVAVPSLIAIDIKDNKDTVEFFSDNKLEQVINAFSGKEVTIELGYLSSEKIGRERIYKNEKLFEIIKSADL